MGESVSRVPAYVIGYPIKINQDGNNKHWLKWIDEKRKVTGPSDTGIAAL
jgi:hypothetical protein